MPTTLAANALTTAATAQGLLSNSASATTEIERLINVASDEIEQYCGRSFYYASRTERLAPVRGPRLILKHTPLISTVTPIVTIDGVSVTDFEIEDVDCGFLDRDGGWMGELHEQAIDGSAALATRPGSAQRVVLVTYTAGYVTPAQNGTTVGAVTLARNLPYGLEQACLDTVASLWRRRGMDPGSSVLDGANEAIGRGLGGIIPGPVLPTLKRYMRWG